MEEVLEAVVAVIVTVLIIIVVATIVTIAIQYIKVYDLTPPSPPATNNVSVFIQTAYSGGFSTVIAGDVYPDYNVNTQYNVGDAEPAFDQPFPNGFIVQYGVDLNTNPWVATIYQTVPEDLLGTVQMGVSTTNAFSFTLTMSGAGTATYTITNSSSDDLEINLDTNVYDSVTDSSGDVATYTPNPQSTNCVILQRSTNLVSWCNMYTDYVSPGAVQTFVDTQIFLPTITYYYNTNTGGDDGIGPTNIVTTNGVLTAGVGAFYRLAYPSNQSDYFSP